MNAKVLLRTVDDVAGLQKALGSSGFEFEIFTDRMEIAVAPKGIKDFERIIRKFLNASYNYANVKFPKEKLNVLIFLEKTFWVSDEPTDRQAKEWALSKGLSDPETRWTVVY